MSLFIRIVLIGGLLISSFGIYIGFADEISNQKIQTQNIKRPGKVDGLNIMLGADGPILTWTQPLYNPKYPITDYIIQYRKQGTRRFRILNDGIRIDLYAVLKDLDTASTYDIRVFAKNKKGRSIGSKILTTNLPLSVEITNKIGTTAPSSSPTSPVSEEVNMNTSTAPAPNASSGGAYQAIVPIQPTPITKTTLDRTFITGCQKYQGSDFLEKNLYAEYKRITPGDCRITRVYPVALHWTEPRTIISQDYTHVDRDTSKPFSIKVYKADGGLVSSVLASDAYTFLPKEIGPGKYSWTVTYTTKGGKNITSGARHFEVSQDALYFPLPDGKELLNLVKTKSLPRSLPTGSTFSEIRDRAIKGEYKEEYDMLVRFANDYLSLQKYPLVQLDKKNYIQGNSDSVAYGVRLQNEYIGKEVYRIETLNYAYKFTGDIRYRDVALTYIRNYMNWALDGYTVKNTDFDYTNRMLYKIMVQTLDLYGDELSSLERGNMIKNIRARMERIADGIELYNVYPYSSHLISETSIALESLLLIAGRFPKEFPESEEYLAKVWEAYRSNFNTWGYEDGGWGNGTSYGVWSLKASSETNAALKIVAGVNMLSHPYYSRFGDFFMAFITPSGSGTFMPFGDAIESTSHFWGNVTTDQFRLYTALTRNPEYVSYWKSSPTALKPPTTSAWHYMLLGVYPESITGVPSQKNAYVSYDAGVAGIYSEITNSTRSALYFRSSQYGAISHSHADQNAIAFESRGKTLLINGGYYPYYGSPHHKNNARLSRYHNVLTFNGGIGQSETMIGVSSVSTEPTSPSKIATYGMDTQGEIINFQNTSAWGAVTGDATSAYMPRAEKHPYTYGPSMLTIAIRTAAYNRQKKVALVYDYATSLTPRSWELNFHAIQPFVPSGATLKITNAPASACMKTYGNPGTYKLSSGFDITPEASDYRTSTRPEQYHARYVASSPSLTLATVTVLVEDCQNLDIRVNWDKEKASVTIDNGAPIVFDKASFTLP